MKWYSLFLTAAQETETQAGPMDGMIDMMDTLLMVMLIGVGIYALYSAFRLYREQMLIPNKFIYPGDCKPEDCLLPGEFIDYILPKVILLGAGLLVMGILFALNVFLFEIDALWLDIAVMVLPLSLFVWYVVMQRKAAKQFW